MFLEGWCARGLEGCAARLAELDERAARLVAPRARLGGRGVAGARERAAGFAVWGGLARRAVPRAEGFRRCGARGRGAQPHERGREPACTKGLGEGGGRS